VTRISKIVALLAFLAASGCRDSFPVVQPPTNVLYFPVGLAVRQVPPSASQPHGGTQLLVANSNFDLRFDEGSGGSLLVVDPDASGDVDVGGQLQVLGNMYTGSFLGEVAVADAACQPGWPDCPSACSTLAGSPSIAAGGARVLVASRSNQTVYRMQMDAAGGLTCGDGCAFVLPIQQLDPYGISIACSARSGQPRAYAFVSQLRSANNIGFLNRVNLLDESEVIALVLGDNSTYTSIYDNVHDRVFVSSAVSANGQFRWFNPLVTLTDIQGFAVPDYSGPFFSNLVPGAVARDMALSSDGSLLYVVVQLFDINLAAQGIFFTQGGALAVFDLTPSTFGEPRMALYGLTRTCVGAGQIERLPSRPGKPDLFAITCDLEGALAIYDSDARAVVRYIGQDPTTGLPALGRYPFGIAVEPIDPARATVQPPGSPYETSPCGPGRDCQRIYVGSFLDNWVNILELDPDQPTAVTLVKRIGGGP
jgi:hypothetical protein